MSKIVLCVDDSATMQQVADITFRGTEFTYIGARSYDEGLDKARSQKPAIVLADSHMPGNKSGYDLCFALKSEASTANVPVVILVGNASMRHLLTRAGQPLRSDSLEAGTEELVLDLDYPA